MIVNCPNYKGLPIERKSDGSFIWVAPKTTSVGRARQEWADKKIVELHITGDGKYAKLMYELHPTKVKVCQICGQEMSINYIYLNPSVVNSIKKTFGQSFDTNTSLYDATKQLLNKHPESQIKSYLIGEFGLSNVGSASLNQIIGMCERKCRIEKTSKKLGPGAMSNFPDRFDGFHSYNRCCRKTEDKGRNSGNMKTYNKDRRAYEYWSDGNVCCANSFMRSDYFEGASADHICPISLGFVHDSHFIRRLSSGDNSSKRDKLQYSSIKDAIEIENKTGICAASWYSKTIWDHLKNNLSDNHLLLSQYHTTFRQNFSDLMYIFGSIIEMPENRGIIFLERSFLEPKMVDFDYDYICDIDGNIVSKTQRRENDANRKEYGRFCRVAIESVKDYNDKSNRNTKPDLNESEKVGVKNIIYKIETNDNSALSDLYLLVEQIQKRLLMVFNQRRVA